MSTTDCFTELIPLSNPKDYVCGAPGVFKAADLKPSKSARQLAVLMTIKPTYSSSCTYVGVRNFLTVSILVSGIRKRVMTIAYQYDLSQILFYVQDLASVKVALTQPVNDFFNAPYNFAISMDLDSGIYAQHAVMDDSHFAESTNPGDLNFGSDWFFDDSMEIAVCSDFDPTHSSTACTVSHLKVAYNTNSFSTSSDLIGKVVYQADYRLNDDAHGNTLKNSLGPLPPITLDYTDLQTPTLIPTGGLEFIDPTQQLVIPTFTPSGSDPVIITSFAITLQIKIDEPPLNDAVLFLFWASDPSVQSPIFYLTLTPQMALKDQIDNKSNTLGIGINVGEWTTIYASYLYTFGGLAEAHVYINGVRAAGYPYASTTHGPSLFRNTDVIRVGPGFKGHLRRVQVYSPAVLQIPKLNCAPSSCDATLNQWVFQTCLQETCNTPGYYTSFGSCEKCLKGCATCSDPTTCESCIEGYYLDDKSCKKCALKHCKACSDPQTCLTCSYGYGFYNGLCTLCPAGTYLSRDGICKKLSQTLQDTLTNSQLANSAVTQAANLLSKGSSVSLSAMVGGKIFSQIKYLNVSYSGELQVALLTWMPSFVSLGLTPDMPESMEEKIPQGKVPYMFEKYGTGSSFLVNFWENLGVLIFAFLLCMLLKGIELLLSPKQNPSKIASFIKKAQIMIQNFLLAALYGTFGDLVLYAIIEYRSFAFGWNLSLLSFMFTIILLVTMFLTFFYQIKILKAYQKVKQNSTTTAAAAESHLEQFTKNYDGSQMFFKDFKDSSLGTQLFPFFLALRDILFSFVLATMFEYPLAQVILITLIDFLMIAYLFIKRPFESTFDFVQQLFFEFVGSLVMISVFINAVFDSGKYETLQARNNIGKLIIVANIMFNFVSAIFMIILLGQSLKEIYKAYKQKQSKKLRPFAIQNRLQGTSLLETSQVGLNNSKTFNTEQNSIASNDMISLQQESFEFNFTPSQQLQRPSPAQFKRLQNNLNQTRFQDDNSHHNVLEYPLRNNGKNPTLMMESLDHQAHPIHKGSHKNQVNRPRRPVNNSEKEYQPRMNPQPKS